MKSTLYLISMPALTFLATLATAQPRYTVTDLGPAGNPFSQAAWLNHYGLIAGNDTAADGTSHAVVWLDGLFADISKPGLGGPNSAAGLVNDAALVVGEAETAAKDPNKENFCGYGTGLQCLPFTWQFGAITALPTLGGTNAGFGGINNLGQIAGYAETNHKDVQCPGTVAVNGTGPQVLDFEPVIWGPSAGQIRQLSLPPGDTVGMALGINNLGQAVGTTGTCANTTVPGFAAGPHAVIWETDGSVHDLGNLGGTVNTTILGAGTLAWSINSNGMVTGQSVLRGEAAFHPFLWTAGTGMLDLGVLPGDFVGAGLNINNRGEIVGASISAPGPSSGNPRAFLWRDGVMSDLNALAQQDSPLYLLTAFDINDSGVIVGFGATAGGDIHGFLATPATGSAALAERGPTSRPALSEGARKTLLRHWRPGL